MWEGLLKHFTTTSCFRAPAVNDSPMGDTCGPCGKQVSEELLAKLRLYEAQVLGSQPGDIQHSSLQTAPQQPPCSLANAATPTGHVSQMVGEVLSSTTQDTYTGPRSTRLLNELGSAAGQHILLIALHQEASSCQHLLTTSPSEEPVPSYHGWRLGQVRLLTDK
jgi:hypothetical protein